MILKRIVNLLVIILCICLVAGVGAFFYNASNSYKVSSKFISVPLQFNPNDSSSTYHLKNTQITVYGGFIKGLLSNKNGTESVVIRALSPLPSITVTGDEPGTVTLLVENVNPDFYAKSISGGNIPMTKIKMNTLELNIDAAAGKTFNIVPSQPNAGEYKFVILGDNRNGYNTFGQIIDQVNGLNPVLVIDNGDLVYSGKPNQYRLFDRMVSGISTTFCTTLGNHDIRKNGRSTYTMLYGPAYYSFNYGNSHYVFLDSSPGWAGKQAISNEQYNWLEKDLKNAQGKRIFVITHIPPRDPRAGVKPNIIPNYVNKVQSSENLIEQKLDDYNATKDMDHGFRDTAEAARFENLMSTYHVDTVYLSHIHSYLEYTKDGVRYLITGGAGAELLTENSYYHYLIQNVADRDTTTMVELPSPTNQYLMRYAAAVNLFANSMYEENPVSVSLIIAGLILLVILLILRIVIWKKRSLLILGIWIRDIGKYTVRHYKELFSREGK